MCRYTSFNALNAAELELQAAIRALGCILDTAAEEGAAYLARRAQKGKAAGPTVYDASEPVPLSTAAYLQRWAKYADLSVPQLLTAAVYIDRFVETAKIALTQLNKHRVVLCALVCAEKWLADDLRAASEYAVIGGVAHGELLRLERAFLLDVQFTLFVTEEEVGNYRRALLPVQPLPSPEAAALSPASSTASLPAALLTTPPLKKSSSLERLLKKAQVKARVCNKAVKAVRKWL